MRDHNSYQGILVISNPGIRQSPRVGIPVEGYYRLLIERLAQALEIARDRDLRPVVVGELVSGSMNPDSLSDLISILIDRDVLWIPRPEDMTEGCLRDRSPARVLESARVITVAKAAGDAATFIGRQGESRPVGIVCAGSGAPWLLSEQVSAFSEAGVELGLGVVCLAKPQGEAEARVARSAMEDCGVADVVVATLDFSMEGGVPALNSEGPLSVGGICAVGDAGVSLERINVGGALFYQQVADDQSFEEEVESEFAAALLGANNQDLENADSISSEDDIMNRVFAEMDVSGDVQAIIRGLKSRCVAELLGETA